MANYERGEEKVTRVRYRLKTPSNGAELGKLLNAAALERAQQLNIDADHIYDDALTVDVGDDEIVIWWEMPPGLATLHTG
jgi:hypothetical protein